MKKNLMMRIASFLLVAVLISTSAISGTYAKYVTSDNASDEARVAKWGISLQIIGDLYADTYKNTPTDWTSDTLTVQAFDTSAADANVVAPGTKNEKGLSFGLTGKPEVDYKVTGEVVSQNIFLKANTYGLMVKVESEIINEYNFASEDLYTTTDEVTFTKAAAYDENATYYTLQDSVDLTKDYYPVVYKLAGTGINYTGDYSSDSLNGIAAAIAAAMNGSAITVTPDANNISTYTIIADTTALRHSNTAIEEVVNMDNLTITWEWEFERKTGDAVITMYDGADTILGNLMATRKNGIEGVVVMLSGSGYTKPIEHTDYCLDTQFSIDITVTQVD